MQAIVRDSVKKMNIKPRLIGRLLLYYSSLTDKSDFLYPTNRLCQDHSRQAKGNSNSEDRVSLQPRLAAEIVSDLKDARKSSKCLE